MYLATHRGYCCGINELRNVIPGDIAGYYPGFFKRNMQYRYHCLHMHRDRMEPELLAKGFVLLATNDQETVWGYACTSY